MTGKVLELENILDIDQKATRLTEKYMEMDMGRQLWKDEILETKKYIFATDTSQTGNSSLPWKNKTTIPKLCQIADNLIANYTLTMFPKKTSIFWEANNKDSNSVDKRNAIQNYTAWMISQPSFKQELFKAISDYVYTGNVIVMPDWLDYRTAEEGKTGAGYVGPGLRRVNPMDLVMNPTAENFVQSPKFIRTLVSMGELREHLERLSNDDNTETYKKLFDYLKEIRSRARSFQGDWNDRDNLYQMDGFGSFRQYLMSDTVEVLTFYGDWYDKWTDTFEKNRVITFVDRHKIINDVPNPSFFGYPPIFHVSWRRRTDNLWGQSPLANLLGMQYRLDHMENMKADMMDLSTYPVQKIKGFVEDFTWQPGEKIFVSEEGDVDLIQPNISVNALVTDISMLEAKMEEMAGAPKEAMGFRSPGEKTKYEVQRLENAASRIFQNKINQFEEFILEPVLNAMLELARRNMANTTSIAVFDDEFKTQTFQDLTIEDITGVGRIRPYGARHFAEQAEMVQNLQGLTQSNMWPFIQSHFSGIKLAKIYEDIFDLSQYGVVTPYIALAEQADAQRQVQVLQEQLHQEMGTATGIGEDFDIPGGPQPVQAPQ